MKTITTVLPVYDKISKQCFERGKKGGVDKPIPIICPRHRLPSMQWNVQNDNPGIITSVNLISSTGDNMSSPVRSTYWLNVNYETFNFSGLDIINAINIGGGNGVTSCTPTFHLSIGDTVEVTGDFVLNSGTAPTLRISDGVHDYSHTLSSSTNKYESTVTDTGDYYINIETAVASNFSFINVKIVTDSFTNYLQNLPELITGLSDEYFQYNEDSLNFLMPTGVYYLKFTTVNGFEYYSDYFEVKCVYKNLIYEFTNSLTTPYFTYIVSDNTISYIFGIHGATGSMLYSNSFLVNKDEVIHLQFNYMANGGGGGDDPFYIELRDSIDHTTVMSNTVSPAIGLNNIDFICTDYGSVELVVYTVPADDSVMYGSEFFVYREYSDKYLQIDFSNTCDLGNILYSEGFTQTAWIESEPMEMTFPQEDKGIENGEGQFIRTFARQTKKYLVKTKDLPDYMVEVFNRMRLHDTVEITDLVGDTNDVYNLEVEHEWLWDDRYYAKIELTFDYDETFVIGGCCNNLT